MRSRTRAFTLVELLTVVAIIALLIGILVPSLAAARRSAKVSSTKASIHVLDMGIEAFKVDTAMDGVYPPSSCTGFGPDRPNDPRKPPGTLIEVPGAALLTWAMIGADMLGPPVHHFNGAWPGRTGGGTVCADNAMYAVFDGRPCAERRQAFVDSSKMRITKIVPGTEGPNQQYEVPLGARPRLNWASFLDPFDQPILYYCANPGRMYVASNCGGNYTTSNGVYELHDNAAFTGTGSGGMDLGNGPLHPLGVLGAVQNARTFAGFIADRKITATPTAQRPDSFLLISAGPDHLYGTADDVTNFQPNN